MLRKSYIFHIFFILVLIVIASCSEYNRILKSDDFQLKYKTAMEYYEEENYVRAATLIEQVLPVYRGTLTAAELQFTLARCYYHRGDYIMAAHHFDSFARDYPTSEHIEEATFMRAYCNYLMSPRPSLDQSTTYRAIDQFRLFISRFPDSDRVAEAQDLIEEMRVTLQEKSFQSAKLYYHMEDYQAAIVAFKNTLAEFPETDNREEIMFLILESSYRLADRSVPERRLERFQATIDEYYAFVEEYPESEYINDAERYFNNSLSILDDYPVDELTLDF